MKIEICYVLAVKLLSFKLDAARSYSGILVNTVLLNQHLHYFLAVDANGFVYPDAFNRLELASIV